MATHFAPDLIGRSLSKLWTARGLLRTQSPCRAYTLEVGDRHPGMRLRTVYCRRSVFKEHAQQLFLYAIGLPGHLKRPGEGGKLCAESVLAM